MKQSDHTTRVERIAKAHIREKSASEISDNTWDRSIDSIIKESQAMKKQVDRFGGIQKALKSGHGDTLKQQLTETASVLRTLLRRLGVD